MKQWKVVEHYNHRNEYVSWSLSYRFLFFWWRQGANMYLDKSFADEVCSELNGGEA